MTRCLLRYLPVPLLFHSEHPDVLGHDRQHNASLLFWSGTNLRTHTLVVNVSHWRYGQDVFMNQVSGKQSWPYKTHETARHDQACQE